MAVTTAHRERRNTKPAAATRLDRGLESSASSPSVTRASQAKDSDVLSRLVSWLVLWDFLGRCWAEKKRFDACWAGFSRALQKFRARFAGTHACVRRTDVPYRRQLAHLLQLLLYLLAHTTWSVACRLLPVARKSGASSILFMHRRSVCVCVLLFFYVCSGRRHFRVV